MSGAMQFSVFDGTEPLKISDKPIRLIELFAGIGAQAKAFERLAEKGLLPNGFEHYRICEFDKYAVQSYNAVHGTDFKVSDITKISAKDLAVVDTDKYNYVMTYSFPCQDISNAGLQKGLGEGTRSGLLREVERLLGEMDEKPQVLMMENVPPLVGDKFRPDFQKWVMALDEMGYTSKYAILNAADYGIPQHRERVFMISWLGSYYYDFPDKQPLKLRLKDMLEDSVDERFYLSDTAVEYLQRNKAEADENGNGWGFNPRDLNEDGGGYRGDL